MSETERFWPPDPLPYGTLHIWIPYGFLFCTPYTDETTVATFPNINAWLPPGWTSEVYAGRPDIIVLIRPGQYTGMVSIDFKRRTFSLGYILPQWTDGPEYKGRNWRSLLVAAAVKYLDEALA